MMLAKCTASRRTSIGCGRRLATSHVRPHRFKDASLRNRSWCWSTDRSPRQGSRGHLLATASYTLCSTTALQSSRRAPRTKPPDLGDELNALFLKGAMLLGKVRRNSQSVEIAMQETLKHL